MHLVNSQRKIVCYTLVFYNVIILLFSYRYTYVYINTHNVALCVCVCVGACQYISVCCVGVYVSA